MYDAIMLYLTLRFGANDCLDTLAGPEPGCGCSKRGLYSISVCGVQMHLLNQSSFRESNHTQTLSCVIDLY